MPGTTFLRDPSTLTNVATVAAFHNTDNQPGTSFAYGLLTGGVAQLINVAGNLDRQRETGVDNAPPLGIASGSQQLASPFATTVSAALGSTGTQTVTPVAMTGTSRGAAWSIQAGSVLSVSNSGGGNSENVVVTAVTSTTFTAIFAQTKTAGWVVSGYTYNQARDATTADGSTGQGFAAGATFLYNNSTYTNGGWEAERSALGELDGASGAGTAIAAEYENNSGGPALSNGKASTLQFDRGRNVAGKGLVSATITAPSAGATSIVVPTVSQVNLLQPGAPLYFISAGAILEVAYVSQTYVPGTSPIALQNPVVAGGETTVWFDAYAPQGPGLNGFTPTGIEIAEEALWDPTTGKYYIERSATQDTVPAYNVVMESPALYNGGAIGVSFDRAKSASGANLGAASGVGGTGTGVELHSLPGMWSKTNTPAAATIATCAQSAGGAGIYNVCTSISATFAAGTAPTPGAPVVLQLFDGTTAGTLLWSVYMNAPATAGGTTVFSLSGLTLRGTANTAMTLAFSAAGPANTYQSVALTGFQTQ